jgi:hypothetical protein
MRTRYSARASLRKREGHETAESITVVVEREERRAVDRAGERVCGTGLGVESEAAQAVESGPAFAGFNLQTPMHLAAPGSLISSREALRDLFMAHCHAFVEEGRAGRARLPHPPLRPLVLIPSMINQHQETFLISHDFWLRCTTQPSQVSLRCYGAPLVLEHAVAPLALSGRLRRHRSAPTRPTTRRRRTPPKCCSCDLSRARGRTAPRAFSRQTWGSSDGSAHPVLHIPVGATRSRW